VEERTAELLRKNSELEQFAYVASHDLQEPLRKIRTFSELLQKSLEKGAPVDNYFNKIQSSAERMAQLINDVLNYSRLSNTEDQFVATDLNAVLQQVKVDFDLLIEQKQAVIKDNCLPVVKGIPLQLQQLFSNPLSLSQGRHYCLLKPPPIRNCMKAAIMSNWNFPITVLASNSNSQKGSLLSSSA
jgi:light-regulated signal transduction histidine kinase (bacteriophytochrome)